MLTPAQVWKLAQLWYHNRLSAGYRGRTTAEVAAIFRAMNLNADFWYLNSPIERMEK